MFDTMFGYYPEATKDNTGEVSRVRLGGCN